MSIVVLLSFLMSIGVSLFLQHHARTPGKIAAPQVPRLPPPVRRARHATLAECRPGDHVAVVGVIASRDELHGPLSGRPCVAYDLELIDVETHACVGRSRRAQPLVIEDGGRRATVDATHAEVRVWHAPPTFLLAGPQHAAMTTLTGAPQHRPLYAYEGRLTRGQEVLVIGVVQMVETVDGAAYRTAPDAAPMALVASEAAPLVVSDRLADRADLVPRAREPW